MERYFEEAGISKEEKELQTLCKYLAKMAIYNYELSQCKPSLLAASVIVVALRAFEKRRNLSKSHTEKYVTRIVKFGRLEF